MQLTAICMILALGIEDGAIIQHFSLQSEAPVTSDMCLDKAAEVQKGEQDKVIFSFWKYREPGVKI